MLCVRPFLRAHSGRLSGRVPCALTKYIDFMAADLREQWEAFGCLRATDVLHRTLPDLSISEVGRVIKVHGPALELPKCSFGRRGHAAYILRTASDAHRLFTAVPLTCKSPCDPSISSSTSVRLPGPCDAFLPYSFKPRTAASLKQRCFGCGSVGSCF